MCGRARRRCGRPLGDQRWRAAPHWGARGELFTDEHAEFGGGERPVWECGGAWRDERLAREDGELGTEFDDGNRRFAMAAVCVRALPAGLASWLSSTTSVKDDTAYSRGSIDSLGSKACSCAMDAVCGRVSACKFVIC